MFDEVLLKLTQYLYISEVIFCIVTHKFFLFLAENIQKCILMGACNCFIHFFNQNRYKIFSNNLQNYDYLYTEGGLNKVSLTNNHAL